MEVFAVSPFVTAASISMIGGIIVACITGTFAFVAARGKEDRGYLRERIATLETREEKILAPLASAVGDLQKSTAAIGQFVDTLMQDREYEKRRREEGRAR